jgi:site-specific recombinase XerD
MLKISLRRIFPISFQPRMYPTASNSNSTLSNFFKWLQVQSLVKDNLRVGIDRPRPERRVICPMEEHEIKALFGALEISKTYSRPGKRASNHSLPNPERNRAFMLFFLDNG